MHADSHSLVQRLGVICAYHLINMMSYAREVEYVSQSLMYRLVDACLDSLEKHPTVTQVRLMSS